MPYNFLMCNYPLEILPILMRELSAIFPDKMNLINLNDYTVYDDGKETNRMVFGIDTS